MSRILILSNGHGEDIIGAVLAQALKRLGHEIVALPLVGKGNPYERAGFTVIGPRREMPSGGFILNDPLATLLADLRAGWFSMTMTHWQEARQAASVVQATLVVGDIYALMVGFFNARRPIFQFQPLVSIRAWGGGGWDTRKSFILPERMLMYGTTAVYTRDVESATWLQRRGVTQATYLGNPMLDALDGVPLELPPPYLLLLPGSRTDAYESLPKMLETCRLLRNTDLTPVVAWAGSSVENLVGGDWRVDRTNKTEGVTYRLEHFDKTVIYITQGAFKACIVGAKVAISTSGTAAEQAAGYGVPVVGFPTSGPQYTVLFAQNQKRLLGDALMLTEANPEAIARAVRQFLSMEELCEKARIAGLAAMGKQDATQRIAQHIHRTLVQVKIERR